MPWEPMKRVPQEMVNPKAAEAMGASDQVVEVWVNHRYECLVRTQRQDGGHEMRHLSIHTHDRGPMRNWRHLQQIKNEVCGELWTGVEFFPPETHLVDTANQYHLFCFPPGVDFGFGLGNPDEALVSDDETVEQWNGEGHKGRQEPWEPGLTTGRTEHTDDSRRRLRELAAGKSLLPGSD